MGTTAEAETAFFTVGHSTLPIERFVALLQGYAIELLADIRTIPRSRHNPQFNGEALAASLRESGIGYAWLQGLGGLRKPRKDSPNGGWRNKGFQGYADYMDSGEFRGALDDLLRLGQGKRTAIMCAEAVPWRCHRSLVADALTVRGFAVEDILSESDHRRHSLTSFARVSGTAITYPPEQPSLL